jgi:hypothetical protein
MKRFLAVLALSSAAAAMAADSGPAKVSGYISDAMCGAKHNSSAPDVACVKKCISGGSKPVFVDDSQKRVWAIDNPDSVTAYYGDHVRVTATTDAANSSVHIAKVSKLSN